MKIIIIDDDIFVSEALKTILEINHHNACQNVKSSPNVN